MQYDRDVKRGRYAAGAAAAVNAAAALHYASTGEWMLAVLAAAWMAGCLILMELFKAQQRTRDELAQIAGTISRNVIARAAITRNVVAPGAISDPCLGPGSVN